MSGGAFNYAFTDINAAIEKINGERRGLASIYKPLIKHLERISNVLKDIEWHESADTCLTDKEIKDTILSVVSKSDIAESSRDVLAEMQSTVKTFEDYLERTDIEKG